MRGREQYLQAEELRWIVTTKAAAAFIRYPLSRSLIDVDQSSYRRELQWEAGSFSDPDSCTFNYVNAKLEACRNLFDIFVRQNLFVVHCEKALREQISCNSWNQKGKIASEFFRVVEIA